MPTPRGRRPSLWSKSMIYVLLSVCLSIYRPAPVSPLHTLRHCLCLSVCPSVRPSVCPSVSLSICLSCLPQSIYLSIHDLDLWSMYVCLSLYLSICLSLYLPVFICRSIYVAPSPVYLCRAPDRSPSPSSLLAQTRARRRRSREGGGGVRLRLVCVCVCVPARAFTCVWSLSLTHALPLTHALSHRFLSLSSLSLSLPPPGYAHTITPAQSSPRRKISTRFSRHILCHG